MSDHLKPFEHYATDAIHAGQEPENFKHWPMTPPISLSTTFKQPTPGKTMGYEYSRGGNPTRNALEEAFAKLSGGCKALVWASGLAGTQAIIQLLKNGDHILAIDDLYGGTNRLMRRIATNMGVEYDFCTTADPEAFAKKMKPNTRLVWIESPTNPLLQVSDIRAIAEKVKQRGDCILVVDNTFMSSYFQRPLELGADIEFASVTKYYNGHSDVLMGVTILKDPKLAERLQFIQFAAGAVPGPFDSYLVNRGLKTLHLRMEAHAKNAAAVAAYLEAHPKVEKVNYPGLKSHPHHEIAKKQSTGFSGMVTFFIKGGLNEAKTFLEKCKVFTLAESLGAVESLCELPAIMTHASVPPEQRAELGISDSLIRLSVGVEDTLDLLNDLAQALDAAVPDRVAGGMAKPDPRAFKDVVPSHKQGGDAAGQGSVGAAASAAVTHDVGTPAPRAGAPTYRDSPHFKLGQAAYTTPAKKPVGGASNADSRPTTSSRRPPGGASTFTFG